MKEQSYITILLTVLLSMVGTRVLAYDIAVENADGVTIYYNYINDGKELEVTYKTTDYNSYSGAVVIPEEITYMNSGRKVTSIGSYAFSGCSGLTSITIPNSVTGIGSWAFYNCSGLTSITIPNSVTNIKSFAFCECIGLTSVTIPNNVTSIDDAVFYSCSGLTSVTIPSSVISIGMLSFRGCNVLASITIPNSVTSIGNLAFIGCRGLTSVTIPSSVTSIGNAVFDDCTGLASIVVESGNTKYDSRDNCNAIIHKKTNTLLVGCKNTIIPTSVTSIGTEAFYGCSDLTSITIPNSVISIETLAFSGCSGLASITIPNSVSSIGQGAFFGTGWYNNQSNGILYLGNWLIGYKEEMPKGMIVVKEGTKGIADGAYSACTGLTSITIPNSVMTIGQNAFKECSNLTSVTIPNSVTSIGKYGFSGCSGLTSFVSLNNEPLPCDIDDFFNVDMNNCVLWVPKGSLDAYKNADVWNGFQNIKELILGDVNLDSEVNHSDLNALVDYVMGKKDPEDFNKSLGDLNGDEVVDAADVVMQVDAIIKVDKYSKNRAPANVEVIDLGLPKGTMWANMNIGAESPEDCGLYFAWGETTGYTSDTSDGRSFDWASYKWMNEGESTGGQVNKYQIAEGHTGSCWYNEWAEFIGDGKTTLELEDDAAYVNWGTNWRMPTCYDFQELFENTTYEWTTLNGVNGLKFTSKINGKSIFLPAAGDRLNSGFWDSSEYGCYWSSSLHVFDSSTASFLIFNWVNPNPTSMADRRCGFSIRPVLRNVP